MREDRIGRTIRLRLLAVVLALVLTWYAANPAPGPVRRRRSGGEDKPDESRRGAESAPAVKPRPTLAAAGKSRATAGRPPVAEEDAGELEWPEFIDVRED